MSAERRRAGGRPYRKRQRAAQEEETRRRITEAAVELHGSLGPARTTVSAVAERAGVQRATVYRHFPDETALFAACSSHWRAANPLPDAEAWLAVAEPDARLRRALEETYAWFERTEHMLEKTTRDLPLVPAMQPAATAMAGWFEAATGVLVRGRPQRGRQRRLLAAAVGHALAFSTWRSLARERGLSRQEAAELMVRLVTSAARP